MSKFFQRLTKLHKPVGRVQFVVFEKIYKCLLLFSHQFFKAQKSSKSSYTVQGIVKSVLLLLCTELTLSCMNYLKTAFILN